MEIGNGDKGGDGSGGGDVLRGEFGGMEREGTLKGRLGMETGVV